MFIKVDIMSQPCIICYRLLNSNSVAEKNTGDGSSSPERMDPNNLKLFFKLLGRYVDFDHDYPATYDYNCMDNGGANRSPIEKIINDGMLSCCGDCSKIVESFCDLYHQLKSIELLIDWKVATLKNIMASAQRVPSRVKEFREVLAKQLKSDPDEIIDFKKDLIKKCRQRLGAPFPRLIIKQYETKKGKQRNSAKVLQKGPLTDNVGGGSSRTIFGPGIENVDGGGSDAVILNENVVQERPHYSAQSQQPKIDDLPDSEPAPITQSVISKTTSKQADDNLLNEIYECMDAAVDGNNSDMGDDELEMDVVVDDIAIDPLALENELQSSPTVIYPGNSGGIASEPIVSEVLDLYLKAEMGEVSQVGHPWIPEFNLEGVIIAEDDNDVMQNELTTHPELQREKAVKRNGPGLEVGKGTWVEMNKKFSVLKIISPENWAKFGKPQFSIIPGTNQHRCSACPKQFKHYPSFESHWNSSHLQIKYRCTICWKTFRRRDNYGIHHRNLHAGIRFQCSICMEMFIRKTLLRTHLQIKHSDEVGWEDLANQAQPIILEDSRQHSNEIVH